MNPLRNFCLLACLLAAVCATPNQRGGQQRNRQGSNSLSNSLKPTEWLSVSELENVPSVDQVSWEQLEGMSNTEGAVLVNQLYHLSQINYELTPNFVPKGNDIPTYVMMPNGQNASMSLNQLVAAAKQQENFGNDEVTIFITGLPQESNAARKATHKLVHAYQRRYQLHQQQNQQQQQNKQQQREDNDRSSSEEDSNETNGRQNRNRNNNRNGNGNGNLVVIDLGATLNTFERQVMLDVEQTGSVIAKVLVQLIKEANVPQEIVHIVAQGIAGHVAGAAGRQFTRQTGHKLRRITALDPSKIFAKNANTLTGLARGAADFVDAIHTSAYGMGIPNRVGDIDFYPNGPSVAMPGTDNIVEASMRATRYYAESVVPGMERNFPAVAAQSLNEYKNNEGYGQRAYMGINTDFDLEGDYILQVNAQSPFGKSAPAQKQSSYHGWHSLSSNKNARKNNNQDYE